MKSSNILKSVTVFLLRTICRIFFKVRVHGTPEMGDKNIFVCNHVSLVDGIIVSLFLPEIPYVVMTKTRAQPIGFSLSAKYFIYIFIRMVMRYGNIITIDPSSPHSMKSIINLVNDGKTILIFPEGKITTDGELNEVQPGVAFMVLKTGARVIPLHLDGLLDSYFSYVKNKKSLFVQTNLYVMGSIIFHLDSICSDRSRKEAIEYISSSIYEVMDHNKFLIENMNRT